MTGWDEHRCDLPSFLPALCQVSSLFDPYAFSGFLLALKKGLGPAAPAQSKKKKKQQQQQQSQQQSQLQTLQQGDDDESDPEADGGARGTDAGGQVEGSSSGASLCVDALQDLTSFVSAFSLKQYQDMLGMLLDACVEITACTDKVPRPAGRGRAAARQGQAGMLAGLGAGGGALDVMGHPRHPRKHKKTGGAVMEKKCNYIKSLIEVR